jgi:hypothetical protein
VSAAPGALRPELAGLRIAGESGRWTALGFAVDGTSLDLGSVRITLGGAGRGITGWTLRDARAGADIDGLPTATTGAADATDAPAVDDTDAPHLAHPNGAVSIDHVVVTTPDFDRTAAALAAAGLPLRRIRDLGSSRQGFRRLGPAILELVEAKDAPSGPARFWGLVVVVTDLPGLGDRLAPHLGEVRPAVQPGRHIATLSDAAGLGPKVAFMDPDPEYPERGVA